MGVVAGDRYRLDIYVVVNLRNAFFVVLDYGGYGPHVLCNETADVFGRAELRVAWIMVAQLRAIHGWSSVTIGKSLRAQVELAVVLLPECSFYRPIKYLSVIDAVASAYSVSQRHSIRWSSAPSTSPSSMSEKISGPQTLTYSTVSGWT